MKSVEGWQLKSLRQLATINYGRSPARILSKDGEYPVVGTGGTERLGRDYLYEGDSVILGRKGSIDRVHFATGRFWTIDTAYYLSDFKQSLPRWLFYFLQTLDLRQLNEATGVPSLSRDLLYKIEVPVPPEAEQAIIAEILLKVDRAIDDTEALIAKQERIKAGLMQDLLTCGIDDDGNIRSERTHAFKDSLLGRIPMEWEVKRLGCMLDKISQGWSPDCESDPASMGEWGVLKTTAVVWEGYQDHENKALPRTLKPRPSLEIKAGDLLMTRAGPNSRVGVVSFVYDTRSKLMLSDKLYRLVPTDKVSGRFLGYSLSGRESQRNLSNLKTGMAESQTNISQDIVKALLSVAPPQEEQKLIADCIDGFSKAVSTGVQALRKLRSLKTGLMQDLLTGDKRVTALLEMSSEGEKAYADQR